MYWKIQNKSHSDEYAFKLDSIVTRNAESNTISTRNSICALNIKNTQAPVWKHAMLGDYKRIREKKKKKKKYSRKRNKGRETEEEKKTQSWENNDENTSGDCIYSLVINWKKRSHTRQRAIKCLLRCGTIGCSSMYMLCCCVQHYTQLGIEWDLAWNTLQPRTQRSLISFLHYDSDSCWLFCSFVFRSLIRCMCFFFLGLLLPLKSKQWNKDTRICLGNLGENTIFHSLSMRPAYMINMDMDIQANRQSMARERGRSATHSLRSFIFRTTLRISLKFNEIHQKGTLNECGLSVCVCVCVRVVRFFVVVDILFISFVAWLDSSCDKMLYLFRCRGFEGKINSVKRNQTTRLWACVFVYAHDGKGDIEGEGMVTSRLFLFVFVYAEGILWFLVAQEASHGFEF